MAMRLVALPFLILYCFCGFTPTYLMAQPDSNLVYVFAINDEIAEPVWHNMQQALKEAEIKNASHFIIHMNTYGGGVEMADSIRTAILKSEIPMYMLINNNAASAGALISIACDKIYMTPGSTIGAATVVTQDGTPAIDKYQSYFRSKMRATAEVTGRDPDIAEAMVDQDIEIEGVTEKGKLLTFTVTEAIANNYCELEVKDLSDLLVQLGMDQFNIIHYQPTSIDIIISFLIHPAVSGVLIMLMMGGIYFELQSPGIGFPIAAAFISAILFFAPLYLEGLAENWEIIIFMVGIIAIAAEIFLIPGTGITGVLGVVLVFGSLTLSMVKNVHFDFTMVRLDGLLVAFSVVMMSFITMSVLTLIMLPRMLSSGRLKALVLNKSQPISEGYISIDRGLLQNIGRKGIAISDLRPSGKISLNNDHFDASSQGSYILKGAEIEVVGSEGPQLIVRKI